MNEQIRKNVFETNSSSSHSLTLSLGDIMVQPFSDDILRNGIVSVTRGEYGWEYYRYYNVQSKMDYLFTQMFRDSVPNGDAEEVTTELREENSRFDMLCRVVETHTGVKVLVTPGSSGYIDHDSSGVGMELFADETALRDFLFSPTSYVETGNDNSGPSKSIGTDRGYEEYHAKFYRTPKESDVMITLHSRSHYDYDSLTTDGGVILEKDDDTTGLFRAICDQATFTAAKITSKSYSHPFEYGDAESDTMTSLAGAELHFANELKIEVNFTKMEYQRGKGYEHDKMLTEVAFTAYVPSELAERLAALPPTPVAETVNEDEVA